VLSPGSKSDARFEQQKSKLDKLKQAALTLQRRKPNQESLSQTGHATSESNVANEQEYVPNPKDQEAGNNNGASTSWADEDPFVPEDENMTRTKGAKLHSEAAGVLADQNSQRTTTTTTL